MHVHGATAILVEWASDRKISSEELTYKARFNRPYHGFLRRRTDIIIKAADKGSGTVIMEWDWYINECLRQLNDTKIYRRLDTDFTSDIQTRVEFFIKRLHKDGFIDYKTKQFLIQTDRKPGRFIHST